MFDLLLILLRIPGALIAFTSQGFGRAYIAHKLGDPTPQKEGKLNLSPASHIDPLGFILILLAGFGWTKPINTNPSYFKNPKKGQILVAAAGPATNLLVGVIFAIIITISSFAPDSLLQNAFWYNFRLALELSYQINTYLAIFTLLPIPFLPGYTILSHFIPHKHQHVLQKMEDHQLLILLGLITILSINNGKYNFLVPIFEALRLFTFGILYYLKLFVVALF